ncbi:Zn-ribbon domain-containing OB-fold protein [Hyphomonas chukchiensis]|uniref:DUF35 domain-containing protein n=1 Tax=Hyphomonas chukchiensis TaxID=1280947 RepID=A0A062UPC6_9PROT|nr:hypothetical protein HY30_15950 [Hyphomonas chukchiensis]|tara:strand:+ start:12978 stop:13394 length:417 start_codon:yes stop_codon:yes gene_type:complete
MQSQYDKPVPHIDEESRPYWAALKREKLILKRCLACSRHHFYPRILCPHCHSCELKWSEASGLGTIYSFTIARRGAGPAFSADAPYAVAIVELDEGVRMMTNIVIENVDILAIGQRVGVIFEHVTEDVTLPKFKLIGS